MKNDCMRHAKGWNIYCRLSEGLSGLDLFLHFARTLMAGKSTVGMPGLDVCL